MAALTGDQYTPLWSVGQCELFALLAVSGVAAGTFSGTIVTAPAGLTNAAAYLLVQGVDV